MSGIDLVLFQLFTTACAAGVILMLWYGLFWLFVAAMERTLAVASLAEAALEASKQGRAPIFRAWRGVGAWLRG